MPKVVLVSLLLLSPSWLNGQQPAPGGVIEGIVLSTDGKAIRGAQVQLMTFRVQVPRGLSASPHPPTLTDSDGRFAFKNVYPGAYRITAAADGYVRQEYKALLGGRTGSVTSITLKDGQSLSDLVLRLSPAANISGTVTADTGEPLGNIEITLLKSTYGPDGRIRFDRGGTVQTDDRGAYRLFWITPGRYYVRAMMAIRTSNGRPTIGRKYGAKYYPDAADIADAAAVQIGPGADITRIDFRLRQQETYRVLGKAADLANAQTPAPVSVSIAPRVSAAGMSIPSSVASVAPAADGSFELRDVPAGSYWIYAIPACVFSPDGNPPARWPAAIAPLEVRDSDVTGIVLHRAPGVTVRGRIQIEGAVPQPNFIIGGTQISLRPSVEFNLPCFAPEAVKPNEEGVFQIENVYPFEYTFRVEASFVNSPESRTYVKSARSGPVDLTHEPLSVSETPADEIQIVTAQDAGTIRGTVIDAQNRPVFSVPVVAVPVARERRDLYKMSVTDPDGRFSFSCPPGDYAVFAWEDIEPFAYFDPDLLRRSGDGQKVHVANSSSVTIEVGMIRVQ